MRVKVEQRRREGQHGKSETQENVEVGGMIWRVGKKSKRKKRQKEQGAS